MKLTPEQVRIALRAASGGKEAAVDVTDLVEHLGIARASERKRLNNILGDLRTRGEINRTGTGLYQIVALKKPSLKTRMWRLLKMRKTVTIEDLVEMSGAAKTYAEEWVRLLHKRGIVRRTGVGRYKLVEESAREPKATEAAARMREMRAKRAAAREALERASDAIYVARKALDD